MGLAQSLSPNERLQRAYHPWTSYVIVPIFALANAGIEISEEFLARAATSPITLGIVAGYVLGKPIGIVGTAWLVTRLTRGRLRIPIGWAALAGTGAIAGIGFTVSLLIASLAFSGPELQEAKLGILSAALFASLLAWMIFGITARLSPARRTRALLGTTETLIDLAVPVNPDRDHIRGPAESKVTLVEYGDFECPYCGQAEPVVRALLANFGDLRYVWRHLPLTDVYPNAAPSAVSSGGTFTAIDFPGRPGRWPPGSMSLATSSEDGRMQREPKGFCSRLACSPRSTFRSTPARPRSASTTPGRSPALQRRRWQQPRLHLRRRRLQHRRRCRRPQHPIDTHQEWGSGYGRLL